MNPATRIYGVDFTSAPRKAKPIVVAHGEASGALLRLYDIERLSDFAGFEALLERPGPWVGGFDFPFGLPQQLVRDLGWPAAWPALVAHCARLSRAELRAAFDAYRVSRPAGRRYAHRETDLPAGSSSPMKLVNPPVALMFHEGAPRLLRAGVHVPGLSVGDRSRVALEAYPGLAARALTRASYKNDARAKQTAERAERRAAIVRAIASGAHPLAVRLEFARRSLARELVEDASGDALDAALCALQAAWAAARPRYGFSRRIPATEGWIISAGG